MRLHYLFGRIISPLHITGFYIHNLIFRTPRARVVVRNEFGELLLVKNWAGRQQWGLPGGGVERGETPDQAARRELYEEIGLKIPIDQFSYIGTFVDRYTAPIFLVTIRNDAVPEVAYNPREIIAMKWFSIASLPKDLSPLVTLALKSLSKTKEI